jgi:pimeloyl-ACP methyl ester carboxylesterase
MPTRQPITVPVARASLEGERWADGGPHIILLHPGVADRRCWYGVAETLAEHGDLVAYDRRGVGRSAPPAESFSQAPANPRAVSAGPPAIWLST